MATTPTPDQPDCGNPRQDADRQRLCELRPHEHAGLVPELSAGEYASLRADIEQRGLLDPLDITPAGVVLDGRARLRAARDLGLKTVPVQIVDVEDEVVHVIQAALLRRQLDASQRAALVLELDSYTHAREAGDRRRLANLRQNTSVEVAMLPPRNGKTRDLAACWAGVSPRTIQDARTVKHHDPDLFQDVKAGRIGAHTAARRVRRRLRDNQISIAPPTPEGPFDLIYADPPWQLGNPDGAHAPENHYPTQPLQEIKQLNPPSAKHAVLYLWAVTCLLPQALEVIQAWGFEYRSAIVWDKTSPGLGNWVRNQHETLLIARKGHYPSPHPEDRPPSVVRARRGPHSQKPVVFYELIGQMYPHAAKLELYARGTPRAGWTAWGNQLEPQDQDQP